MRDDTPVMRVSDLRVAYRRRGLNEQYAEVLKGVSFNLYSGKVLAVLGESGSGKSTIAKAVSGLLPTSARIESGTARYGDFFADLSAAGTPDWYKTRGSFFTMIFQDARLALNPLMTVREHFKELLVFHRLAAVRDVDDVSAALLQKLNFTAPADVLGSYPFQLSGGMCQRVYIALSLCLRPKVLIADEPTSALDTVSQREVLNLIKHIQREFNLAVLLITHDIAVARTAGDSVMALNKGIVEETGDVKKVFAYPESAYTKELIASRARIETIECRGRNCSETVLLSIENLAKNFSRRGVLHDLNLTLHEKEVIGILGASGCGKSTLARCIVALEKPDGGKVLYSGTNTTALSRRARRQLCRHIQIIFQDARASLNPRHTALRLVMEPLRYFNQGSRNERAEKARHYLALVGLDVDTQARRPPQLSTGQCQRVAIARALVLQPDILICDEAVSALDMSIQSQILELLRDLHEQQGFSILMISHDIRILRSFCHKIAVMKDGGFNEISDSKNMRIESAGAYTRALLESEPAYE
ncbi:MAG: ABC transporter ATP-binding protein [Spirochaetaceae bacterium]|jgi:peptide/nickel transport system ATP-binding protein|nr:ABC transporter ATP-binding protein [Spirochaetaceae bacterium]